MTYKEIPGWFEFEEVYDFLASQVGPCDRLVEIGCWLGRSSIYLASKLKQKEQCNTLFCVDTFNGSPTEEPHLEEIRKRGPDGVYLGFLRNRHDFELDDFITPIRATSHSAAYFLKTYQPFRSVFIDGEHHYESVKSDIEDYWPMVIQRGYLAGHDYQCGWEGVDQAVKEFSESNSLTVECSHNCFLIQKPISVPKE